MTTSSATDRRTSVAGLVSVVVTTRDVERTLEACLRSVRAQDHQPLELLVVDNSSTDRTVEIAARLADVVLTAGPERSAQRNLGAATARGEWLLWIDADMLLAPDVVSSALPRRTARALPRCRSRRPPSDQGSGRPAGPSNGPATWTTRRCSIPGCFAASCSPRWAASTRRWPAPRTRTCDSDWPSRVSWWPTRAASSTTTRDGLTLRGVLRKRIYYGGSLPAFAANNPGAVRQQAMATVRAFVRHRRRLARDPAHAVGLLGLRALEAAGYAVGAARGARARRR